MSDLLLPTDLHRFMPATMQGAIKDGWSSAEIDFHDSFRNQAAAEFIDIAEQFPHPDRGPSRVFVLSKVGLLQHPNSILESETLQNFPAAHALVAYLVGSVNADTMFGSGPWEPDDLVVNYYEPGNFIGPHYDARHRQLVKDATNLGSMLTNMTETVDWAEIDGISDQISEQLMRQLGNTGSVDLLFQLKGTKPVDLFPSFVPPYLDQHCLSNYMRLIMTPGFALALRREQTGLDDFPVLHRIPEVSEPSLSIVLAKLDRGPESERQTVNLTPWFQHLMIRQYLIQKS